MHATVLALAPFLAAAKSKAPFYVAGGILVAWALLLSVGIGLRNARFVSTPGAARTVMAVSAALVLITLVAAVATSGGG